MKNNTSPEEKIRGLPGRLIGAFLIPTGLVIIGANFLTITFYEKEIVGGESIGSITFILGIACLILIPNCITLGDFLVDRPEFIKKIWAHSNTFFKLLWLLVAGISICVFFHFLNLG